MKRTPTPEMTASGQAIAEEIFAIEAELNILTKRAGKVIGAIAQDADAHGLSIAYGQPMLTSAVTLAERLNTSREAAIDLHKSAAVTARLLGVEVTNNNPGEKPPMMLAQQLQLVDTKAA